MGSYLSKCGTMTKQKGCTTVSATSHQHARRELAPRSQVHSQRRESSPLPTPRCRRCGKYILVLLLPQVISLWLSCVVERSQAATPVDMDPGPPTAGSSP